MELLDMKILFFSALPVTELRATIPIGLAMGMPPLRVYLLAVVGNLIPIVPLLLILEPINKWLLRFPFMNGLFQRILLRARNKGKQIKKFGIIGLLFFVAVPFPGTGAWTGAVIAWFLGLPFWPVVFAISSGVLTAGLLVTMLSMGIIKIAVMTDLQIFFAALAIVIVLTYCVKGIKRD